MNPKYQNGKIYKLVNKNTRQMLYIGSTIQTLNQRLVGHKSCIKNRTSKTYREIERYGIENIIIELIENFPCNSKKELEKKEGSYIKENYDNIYNINIPHDIRVYTQIVYTKRYYSYTTKLLFLIIVINILTQHVNNIIINIQSKNITKIILFIIYKNFTKDIFKHLCYINMPQKSTRFTQDDIDYFCSN